MSLDDDFTILSLLTKGPWAFDFALLALVATCWQCSRERDCMTAGGHYLWESSTCIKQDGVIEDPQ